MALDADPRSWQGGMEPGERYCVGGHQNWVGQAADVSKQGYYPAYDVASDRGSYYGEHGHPLGGDLSAACDPAAYGGGSQILPVGQSAAIYDAVQHPAFPTAGGAPEVEHWHLQMLSQADPFIALPMRDGHVKRKRRRVISVEQRKAANIRERRRMYQLNEAFDGLRKRVPTFAYEKKLSRIETLKLAVTYIEFMSDLLENNGEKCKKLLEKATPGDKRLDRSPNDDDDDAADRLDADADADVVMTSSGRASLPRSPGQSADGERSRGAADGDRRDS